MVEHVANTYVDSMELCDQGGDQSGSGNLDICEWATLDTTDSRTARASVIQRHQASQPSMGQDCGFQQQTSGRDW